MLHFFKKKKEKETTASKVKDIHDAISIPSFKDFWAKGAFDDRDYFALTAPLDQWGVEYPLHCVSEPAGEITEKEYGYQSLAMLAKDGI